MPSEGCGQSCVAAVFRRQVSPPGTIGPYIADFLCYEARLMWKPMVASMRNHRAIIAVMPG